ALKHALAHWDLLEGPNKKVTVCSDAQAALDRLKNTAWGPGQFLATRAIGFARELRWKGVEVELRWVPGHKGIEGNERADAVAKEAAGGLPLRGPTDFKGEDFTS